MKHSLEAMFFTQIDSSLLCCINVGVFLSIGTPCCITDMGTVVQRTLLFIVVFSWIFLVNPIETTMQLFLWIDTNIKVVGGLRDNHNQRLTTMLLQPMIINWQRMLTYPRFVQYFLLMGKVKWTKMSLENRLLWGYGHKLRLQILKE